MAFETFIFSLQLVSLVGYLCAYVGLFLIVLLDSLLLGELSKLKAPDLILNIAIVFLEFAVLHDLADQLMKLLVLHLRDIVHLLLRLLFDRLAVVQRMSAPVIIERVLTVNHFSRCFLMLLFEYQRL